MVSTGLAALDQLLGGTGYPDGSVILAVGPPGGAKDLVGYHLFHSGLNQGDFCIYVTRQPVREVLRHMGALGFLDLTKEKTLPPNAFWIAPDGGQMKYAHDDLASLSLNIKKALVKGQGRRIRIVIDTISSLLMLNPPESVYRFLDQLFPVVKRHDAVLLATLEEGMHVTQVLVAMEQLFDGILEVRTIESGEGDTGVAGGPRPGQQQTLHVRKMMGIALPSDSSIVLASQAAQVESYLASGGRASSPSPRQGTLDRLRIAVLPFANISPDPSDEYLADGMTEELISTISKVSALRVIARTSVMRYKNNPQKGIDEIGLELRAGTILEGSVRKDRGKLRITAQLIDTETSEHLWAESYEREFKDVFAIQGDVSKSVAGALRVKLLAEEKREILKEHTNNGEAFAMYLRGQFVFRSAWNESEIRKAMDLYQGALELDPSFSLARVRLADGFAQLGNGGWLSPSEAFPRAEELARRALDQDPNLPEAHSCMAYIRFNKYDWQGAIDEVRKALELNPNFSDAHSAYAGYLWVIGKLDRAVEEAEKALELDPFSPDAHYVMVQALYFSKKYEYCKEFLKRLVAVDPSSGPVAMGFLGQISLQESRFDEAIAEFQRGVDPPNGSADFNYLFIAQAYLLSGRKKEAERVLGNFREAVAKKKYVPAANMAVMHLVAGEDEEALDWLEKATDEQSLFGIQSLKVSPLYDRLRNHPRFQALMERVGLETVSS